MAGKRIIKANKQNCKGNNSMNYYCLKNRTLMTRMRGNADLNGTLMTRMRGNADLHGFFLIRFIRV